eukprot:m.63897 g.63897  ORF g.63897 m.63897 type:complete len:300 (+) comp23360_c0_seq1:88-987(+)
MASERSETENEGLVQRCQSYFGSSNLYTALGITNPTPSAKELKKAYRKTALKVHPDRVQGDDEAKALATKKFQTLSQVYKFLSDDECRKIYDETGIVDEERSSLEKEDGKSWSDYFREMFPKVSTDSIEKDKKMYQNSKDEHEDLKKAYLTCKGDMEVIMNNVVHCTIADEPRFREILNKMISDGEVKAFKNFSNENKSAKKKRTKRAAEEEVEAEAALREILQKKGSASKRTPESDLFALIRGNQSQRGSAIDAIEAKYGARDQKKAKKRSSKKAKKSAEMPSEEEYAALQKKLFNKE